MDENEGTKAFTLNEINREIEKVKLAHVDSIGIAEGFRSKVIDMYTYV